MKKRLLLALAASCPAAMAVDYTWTGAAADGDWNNQLNWTDIEGADGVPVDDNVANLQLTLNAADRIIFDGSTMPTENVPSINSGTYVPGATGNESTPTLVLNSGGSITFPSVGDIWTNDESGVDRTVFTIGDGIGGPGDVTLVSAGSNCFMRHADGTHRFQINSDGVFISNGGANRWSWNGTSRQAVFTIDGGSVDINGTLGNAGQFHAGAVVFSSVGGTFSADFNPTGVFPDLAAVQAELGPGKDFQSSDPLLVGLNAQDNGDGSFTVTAVLPPPPNYWTGNGGSVLGDGSNNFTVNQPADVLSEDTLASLIGVSDKATFGDNYFFSNGSSPVATS